MWDTNRGFGERSWRYSAVINDNKIEKIFVEVGRRVSQSTAIPLSPATTSSIIVVVMSIDHL